MHADSDLGNQCKGCGDHFDPENRSHGAPWAANRSAKTHRVSEQSTGELLSNGDNQLTLTPSPLPSFVSKLNNDHRLQRCSPLFLRAKNSRYFPHWKKYVTSFLKLCGSSQFCFPTNIMVTCMIMGNTIPIAAWRLVAGTPVTWGTYEKTREGKWSRKWLTTRSRCSDKTASSDSQWWWVACGQASQSVMLVCILTLHTQNWLCGIPSSANTSTCSARDRCAFSAKSSTNVMSAGCSYSCLSQLQPLALIINVRLRFVYLLVSILEELLHRRLISRHARNMIVKGEKKK